MAYGNDPWTARAEAVFAKHFGAQARVYPVATGTAANVISLACATRPYHAVICSEGAHLHLDECSAPEWHLGCKLVPAATKEGKVFPAAIEPLLAVPRGVHSPLPRVVTISQCTEVGTVYTAPEMVELSDFCKAHGLLLHVDGARLCNAAAALDVSLAALTTDVGVDLLSFGGTKNGLMGAEAVVVLNPDLGPDHGVDVGRIRKQSMQLSSKMRFVSAQLTAMLETDLWQRSARHANAMAAHLAEGLCALSEVSLAYPRESNGVFAHLPPAWVAPLQAAFPFHVWNHASSVVRLMTAFDTTEDDVNTFINLAKDLAS